MRLDLGWRTWWARRGAPALLLVPALAACGAFALTDPYGNTYGGWFNPGAYGWYQNSNPSNSGFVQYNNNGTLGALSNTVIESGASAGNVTWYQLWAFTPNLGVTANWQSLTKVSWCGQSANTGCRIGYAPQYAYGTTPPDVPHDGFYVRLDPTLSTPDSTYKVCAVAGGGAEVCADSGISAGDLDVKVRAVSSSEIGLTLNGGAEITICASGCTITAAPTGASLCPSYEAITNTSARGVVWPWFYEFKATGLSR